MNTYTWNKLAKNTFVLRPYTPQPTPHFETELIMPYVGTKSVLVKLKAWGVTEKALHNVTLLFGDCEILTGDHPELSLKVYFKLTYKGETYYIKKFSATKNILNWRCDCKDAFFTWCYYSYRFGHCLYGPPPRPYVRKTKNYPPRNPRKIIGFCKHAYNAWAYLRAKGLALN